MDVETRTRNQLNKQVENFLANSNLRLSYSRGFIGGTLVVFALLKRAFAAAPEESWLGLYLAIGYFAYVLAGFVIARTIARKARAYPRISLYLDVLVVTGISWVIGLPVFGIAYLPALLLGVFARLTDSALGVTFVGFVNIIFFYVNPYSVNFSLGSLEGIAMLAVFAGALLFPLTLYFITGSGTALMDIGDKLLARVLDRSDVENITELQSRVQSIYRVSSTLTSSLDYQKVVRDMLTELELVFDISVGVVLLFEGTTDSLKVADSEGLNEVERKRLYSSNQGVVKEALAEAQPFLINDDDTINSWRKLFPSLAKCRAALIMPLRGGYEVYGLLLIASQKVDKYHSSDVQLMVALTSHTIVAMQNATLYKNLLAERNKMLTSEEEVRHTLARNLHDGPAQAVASFSMQIEFIRRLMRSEPERAYNELAILGKQALQTSKEIRTLLYELRPLVLESQGLEAALEQYASRFPTNQNDPAVHFSRLGEEDIRLSPSVENTIFTILQEAVNNARKHAQAKNIWLQLDYKEGYINAVAQDDGKGFDTSAIEQNYDKRGSLGMTNMRERAALVGGKVTIESRVGKGTRVIIRIPLTESNLASDDAIETVS
ncbi:MAG: GAF domain-containing sensor histidine kinase [Chloroflexi bacterium]|nr:GAF domain-containing sensor histidine kinase [Chloroflexota bacterium]OJV92574.1 MAG: hypothetical protein BGO39_32245 [Chloroflexi bacterium 54-19]